MEIVGSVLRSCRFAVSLFALVVAAYAQDKPIFTSPLPTGLRLDPVGDAVELGSLPIMLKGNASPPIARNHAPLHALASSR